MEDVAAESNNNSAGPVLISKSEHDISTKVDNMFLSCPQKDIRKRTLKSLNRLPVEGWPTMSNIPASPEDKSSQRLLSEPRPSI